MAGLLVAAVPHERRGRGGRHTSGAGYSRRSHRRSRLIAHFLVVMDAAWLEVVRERSQFLLLQFWRASDWSLNARTVSVIVARASWRSTMRESGRSVRPPSWSVLRDWRWRSLRVWSGPVSHPLARTSVAMGVGHELSRACYSWCRRCGRCGATDRCGLLCVAAGDLRMDVLHNRRHDLLGVRVDSVARTGLHQRSGSEVSARYGDIYWNFSRSQAAGAVRILDSSESAGDRVVARDWRVSSPPVCTACPVRSTTGRASAPSPRSTLTRIGGAPFHPRPMSGSLRYATRRPLRGSRSSVRAI